MTGFLTENARRAYPLESVLPAAYAGWSAPLRDACVYSRDKLGDGRISLLGAEKRGASLVFTLGVPGCDAADAAEVAAEAGRGFATAYGESPSGSLKALLTVDRAAVAAALADADLGDSYEAEAGHETPLAVRCTGGATPRVTSIEAYGAPSCETRRWAGHGGETPAAGAEGGDVTLAAKDGVDLEVVEMAPLEGRILRVSAIAAPADAERERERIHMMVRGDKCFTVETLPGVRPSNGGLVRDADSGVIRVGTVCKPCCQCEDYEAAADMLHERDDDAAGVKAVLDAARLSYNEALHAFNEAKAAALGAIDSVAGGMQAHAVAVLSGGNRSPSSDTGMYSESTASGSRMRITITLRVTNMMLSPATVYVGNDPPPGDAAPSGFRVAGYRHLRTDWTHSGADPESRTGRPADGVALKPGESLVVVATYAKDESATNNAERPAGMRAYVDVLRDGSAVETLTVPVL